MNKICMMIKYLLNINKFILSHSVNSERYNMKSEKYKEHNIEYIYKYDHYEIYVDGKFRCSCNENELKEELKEIKEIL